MRLTKTLPKAPPARVPRGAVKPRPQSPYTRDERRPLHSPRVIVALGLFGLLVVLGLILDLSRFTRGLRGTPSAPNVAAVEELVRAATAPYRDPAGRFAFPVPAGWRVLTGEAAAPYDVRMIGPLKAEFSVQVAEPRFVHPMVLRSDLRRIEANRDADTHIEEIQHRGQTAFRRTCRLRGSTLRMLDFLHGPRAYHLLISVPPELFESFGPSMELLLQRFEPLPALPPPEPAGTNEPPEETPAP